MKNTDVIQPLAMGSAIAADGDKEIPNQSEAGTNTSTINDGFLPLTSEPTSSGGRNPQRTNFNGMFYLSTDQRFYLQNGGVITYDPNVVAQIGGYPQDAILGYIDPTGNLGFVKSLINDNAYNFVQTPSYINGQYWEYTYFSNFQLLENKISPIGAPKISLNFSDSFLPNNCIWLEGAEVSRTTYSNLFQVYGTTYGIGDGSTTFNLPDFRDRAIWGSNSFGYIAAGLPNITGAVAFSGTDNWANYSGAFANSYTTTGAGRSHNSGQNASQLVMQLNAASSNNIYGNSSTVQPPAIKVRVYTRYQ